LNICSMGRASNDCLTSLTCLLCVAGVTPFSSSRSRPPGLQPGEGGGLRPAQSLPECLAARNSHVADCELTGESLALPPDHPLKWPHLLLFADVQSKDQMAASHLEGLLAGPDSSKTRVLHFCFCESGESHCSPGLTPSSRTPQRAGPQTRFLSVRLALSLQAPSPSIAVLLACLMQACHLHLLTMPVLACRCP
jgi:hypothetical protein